MHRLLLSAALASAIPVFAAANTEPIRPLSPAEAAAIVAELRSAPAQGIVLPDIGADVAELSDSRPPARAKAQARLIRDAVAFAAAEHGMDLDPQAIDPNFDLRAPYDAQAAFDRARAEGRIGAWLDAQTRKDPAYLALLAARAQYAALAASGWPAEVLNGAPLEVGMRDARVPALVERLAAEGYVIAPPPAPPLSPSVPTRSHRHHRRRRKAARRWRLPLYDDRIAAAVADFQSHHGIPATGVLDATTVAALNVSPADRLQTIDVNLERARWLPVTMPADRIEADIAGPIVTLLQGDAPSLTMRAVAGTPRKQTPIFASEVVAVVFNPPWYVPADIARKELFPHEVRSPGYFARNDFIVSKGALIQKAGPMSSLGYIKFDVPDPYEIYLHDTPSRGAFASSERWRSHGCMRLQMPRELAAALLAPQGWTSDAVDKAIADKATRRVPLATKTPIFVVYRTAEVADDGKVDFRSDVYGWDAELAAAMAGGRPAARHPATAPRRQPRRSSATRGR